ncbi:hypothetical protein ACJMK2_040065 [Sinanodonta woodiana]|uniref:Uncharacterized protein n=1 Tax=Sinanodonta woodiana TaxID=1069815 RepID=A0ABD3WHA7_SINWO
MPTDKPTSYAEAAQITMRPQEITKQDKWIDILTPNKTSRSPRRTIISTSNPFKALTKDDCETITITREIPIPIRTSTPKGKRLTNKRKTRSPASIEKLIQKSQKPRK